MATRAELRSSLRALLGAWAGDRAGPLPEISPNIPASASPLVRDAVAMLVDYQGVAHARLYLHRLRRFIGRRDVDDAMFAQIVRLMAERMSYDDAVRLAQLTLNEAMQADHPVRRHCRFRFDELVEPLPAALSRPVLAVLERLGWKGRMMTRRYAAHSGFARGRLRLEAGLRRWRWLGHCHERERLWVERWLHMIDRALARRPEAASAVIETATMVRGYGEAYRRGLADWHLLIEGLVKPTLDGKIPLNDLAAAIATARRATLGDDVGQTGLRAAIAEIRDGAGC